MKKVRKSAMALVLVLALFLSVCTNAFAATAPDKENNAQLSREAAAQGMVLLENKDSALPIPHGQTVALFGSGQINFVKGGWGSGDVNTDYVINLLQGMQGKEQAGEISLYQPLITAYKAYLSGGGTGEMTLTDSLVSAAAQNAKTAVVTISRNSGEGSDRSAAKGDYYLSDAEISMLNKVTSAGFQKVAVVLNIGGVIDTSWIKNYPGISVLIAWQPGMEGGNAVADVLCGDVNPSGKLVDTFAKSYSDYPSSANFAQHSSYVNYAEDIFVGYRYFETFDSGYKKVNYEFGYGLSYTTFSVSDVEVVPEGENIEISATVTNTGGVAGKEVVQTYFSAPQGELGKPGKELAAFAKTKLLAPGEAQTVNMSYAVSDMASYDDTGKVQKAAYVLEPGVYDIYVGNSVRNAGEEGIRDTYTVDDTIVAQQLTQKLAPARLSKRLLADGTYEALPTASIPVPNVTASGKTKVEMEDFTESSDQVTIESYTTAAGSGKCVAYMNFSGNYISYVLNVEETGNYNLTFRASNGRAQINDMVKIYVDDALQPGVNVVLPRTGDGDGKGEWYNFADCAPVVVTLPKGTHTLKIVSNGNCGNFDSMTFEKAAQPTLNGAALQTEDAARDISELELRTENGNAKILLKDVYEDPDLMQQFLSQLSNAQLADLSQGKAARVAGGTGGIGGLSEYGIPGAQTSDGPAGIRLTAHCTAWPCSTLQACTWDIDLVKKIGAAVGEEALANGVDIWLAPGMNIHRDPLCGRNFEYYSEDPLIAGKIAAALTNGVQSQGVGVTLKHFACNNKESNRSNSDSRVSERALREIYLRGFEIAVREASPWCIMSSYNLINGVETAESEELLTGILRDEWGYTGMVMTDWGNNSISAREVKAGNDVKMPSGNSASILGALETGALTRADLERNIACVLNMIMKTNVFQTKVLNEHAHEIGPSAATRINAVDYSWGSEGIGAEACKDADGGSNTTNTNKGTWLSYQINVQKSGLYNFYPRIACNVANASFDLFIDDAWVGSFTQGTATGGWQNWITGAPLAVSLPQGEHTLKLSFTATGMNLNWMKFVPLALTAQNIVGVENPEGIQVAYGTALEDIAALPETVTVTLNDARATRAALPTVWTDPGFRYDPHKPGAYTLTGTPVLPSDGNITNINNRTAKISVTVLAQSTAEVDKTKLGAAIAAARALQQSSYTAETWATLQTMLSAAQTVYENVAATQEQTNTALSGLTAALNGLKTRSNGSGHNSGSGSSPVQQSPAPSTVPATSFKLDTTDTYTFGVNGKYCFLVKTDSPAVPTVTSSSASVTAVFSRKVDGGYLFEIMGVSGGTAVITAQIGNEVASFPVVVAGTGSVRSDTTLPFRVNTGERYCFRMTVAGSAVPGFSVGNGTAFRTRFVRKADNDYFFEIQAIGTSGMSAGIYTVMPGEAPVRHCVVHIA